MNCSKGTYAQTYVSLVGDINENMTLEKVCRLINDRAYEAGMIPQSNPDEYLKLISACIGFWLSIRE